MKSRLKNQPDEFINFISEHQQRHHQHLEPSAVDELAHACICRVWQGGGREATVGKITELATITAMLFGARQWWPHQLVLLTVLPQLAFWVFVGELVGCTFRWVFQQTVARKFCQTID
ncbi:hypothetical protein [Microcoleus sp. herbarium2]|uniref:hypothetical protein n=1 Tax=Microcoleus sp. herbarium2 TaxID=3055433 RepID=UPI002FCF2E93